MKIPDPAVRGVLAGLALGAAHLAHAVPAPDPLSLLDTMSRGFRELNYRGNFTYEQGQRLSSARIVHAVVDGVERERLVHLDGSEREFLRLDHPLNCVHAGNRLMRFGAGSGALPAPGAEPQPAAQLSSYYAFEFDGSERVASHDGRRVRVSPRDPYRYGMILVLDESSALLLKAETTDGAGRVLERFQFVDVEIGGTISPGEVLGKEPGSRIEAGHEDAAAAPVAPFAWTVAWLPAGFELSAREMREDAGSGREVETQMYTDGLAVFSVFVERELLEVTGPGQATQGATVAFVTPRGAGNVVTVVGEIPVETAQLVANSVNFQEPSR